MFYFFPASLYLEQVGKDPPTIIRPFPCSVLGGIALISTKHSRLRGDLSARAWQDWEMYCLKHFVPGGGNSVAEIFAGQVK